MTTHREPLTRSWIASGVTLALTLSGCGGDSPSGVTPGQGTLRVLPNDGLVAGPADTLQFVAEGRDAQGDLVSNPQVTWSVDDPQVASLSASGLATAGGSGVTTVRATWEGISASAQLESYQPAAIPEFRPDTVYFGREIYAEYEPGTLPVIISAPHGGDLEPDEVPDRTYGVTGNDRNTQDLARLIADSVEARMGARPHLVISRLMRVKLDPNREVVEAAQGSRAAEVAWTEYHGFVDAASEAVEDAYPRGLYLDIHGHGHPVDWVELGYLLSSSELGLTDDALDGQGKESESSIRELAGYSSLRFSELLRGPRSFGSMLMARGYRSVPSLADPDPDGQSYFSGGYSTWRHGSVAGGTVSGIQLEHQFDGLRDTGDNRARYAGILAEVIEAYLADHFGVAETTAFPKQDGS